MLENVNNNKKLAVVGCSGLVGSSILRCALEKGYEVNGTMRDIEDRIKTKYLKKLNNSENLTFFKADMSNGMILIYVFKMCQPYSLLV